MAKVKVSSPRVQTFGYYGGKQSRLSFILPLLPPTRTYIEPFFGTGAVFLNKRPRSEINIINDLDDNMVNLFRQIRDNGDELRRLIHETPYSRTEFLRCAKMDAKDPLERARQALVTIIGCFNHTTYVPHGVWRRSGKANIEQYLRATEGRIEKIMDELRRAQIERRPAAGILRDLGDTDDCLFYLDPPYVPESRTPGRAYTHEMSAEEHLELMEAAVSATCKVAISGYRNEIYDAALTGWHVVERDVSSQVAVKRNSKRAERTEVVWMNYKPTIQGELI